MANISAIKLPNNTTYTLVDNTSGYTKNTGTITQVKTTAGTHSVINVTSGAANFNVPTKTSHLTNDSGFITSVPVISVNSKTGAVSLTASDVGAAPTTRTVNGHNLSSDVEISSDEIPMTTPWTTLGVLDVQGALEYLDSNMLTSETDPVFTASAAHGISSSDIANWNGKQAALVSGTNIKTINGNSLLGSGNINILLYEPGDSITYGEYESGLVITGFVTSSKKEDHYTIPLSKPCTASTVTITNFGLICRQNNSYVHGTGATTYKTPSYTATLTGQDSDGAYTSIKVVCTWSNTTNVVNNAPIAANIRGVFTFS